METLTPLDVFDYKTLNRQLINFLIRRLSNTDLVIYK